MAVSVSGVVKASAVSPCRDDFTIARRAAKQLALKSQVTALYAHTCSRCLEIQDAEDPGRCCGPVRPMLVVARPEGRRLILHPASPLGGEAPAWINVVPPPRAPGQLPVPDIDDLARLVLRRCYEGLESGRSAVQLRDAAALLRLAREIEQDQTAVELSKARAELAMGEEAFMTVLWTARNHFYSTEDQRRWQGFMDDLRAKLERVLGPSAAGLGC